MINHQTATATGTASSSSINLQENNILGHHHHHHQDHEEAPAIRDIHPLTPPHPPRREAWPETSSHRSSSLSIASNISENGENFTSMSREFNALVLAGSNINTEDNDRRGSNNLGRIGEEDNFHEETNPLAIVPEYNSPLDGGAGAGGGGGELDVLSNSINTGGSDYYQMNNISVQSVKKEEVESKINAWVAAKIAKINNRFKRDDAIINGWEGEQVQKATLRMKKVERKLEAKRAKAMEKMQNDIAKAHRKAEERRASAEAKRGTKVAGVLEVVNLMKAVGRAPAKRSFF